MKILMLGLVIFFMAFIVHLALWKIRIPQKQTMALIKIFFVIFILGVPYFNFFSATVSFDINDSLDFFEFIHLILLYIALMLSYIITYSGIEADGPTLVMIMHIFQAGEKGLSREKLCKKMTDDTLVKPRIRDLTRDNLAYVCNGKYRLTKAGFYFIQIFIIYRKLLNAPKGG